MSITEYILIIAGAIALFIYGLTYRDENNKIDRGGQFLIFLAVSFPCMLLSFELLNADIGHLMILLLILFVFRSKPKPVFSARWIEYMLLGFLVLMLPFAFRYAVTETGDIASEYFYLSIMALIAIFKKTWADKKWFPAVIPAGLMLAIIILEY